ncbi:MAG: DnaT-like ssDNA-binding domain-containing protein [Motiliproteus sp.]
MSGLFPEHPVLFYPSLAQRYGAEEAILLAIYQEFARHHGAVDGLQQMYFLARRMEWQQLAPFWDEEQLATLTNSLVTQQAIEAEFNTNGSIRVLMINAHGQTPASATVPAQTVSVQTEVYEVERKSYDVETACDASNGSSFPARSMAYKAVVKSHQSPDTLLARGPAPSFGGSTGWNRPQDDLHRLFDQQEKRNQQLHEIDMGWKPSATTYQMLAKHNVPDEFADNLIDEFIAYWLAQNKKKASWDPHFIDHVKRKWVQEQSRQGRRTFANKTDQELKANGERYKSNNRAEKRERITEAVMDIKNVDW